MEGVHDIDRNDNEIAKKILKDIIRYAVDCGFETVVFSSELAGKIPNQFKNYISSVMPVSTIQNLEVISNIIINNYEWGFVYLDCFNPGLWSSKGKKAGVYVYIAEKKDFGKYLA